MDTQVGAPVQRPFLPLGTPPTERYGSRHDGRGPGRPVRIAIPLRDRTAKRLHVRKVETPAALGTSGNIAAWGGVSVVQSNAPSLVA